MCIRLRQIGAHIEMDKAGSTATSDLRLAVFSLIFPKNGMMFNAIKKQWTNQENIRTEACQKKCLHYYYYCCWLVWVWSEVEQKLRKGTQATENVFKFMFFDKNIRAQMPNIDTNACFEWFKQIEPHKFVQFFLSRRWLFGYYFACRIVGILPINNLLYALTYAAYLQLQADLEINSIRSLLCVP